jgi:hypothetical protein
MIEAMKQAAEDVSRAYDVLAFAHPERALELLAKTRTCLRQAIKELESQEPVAWGVFEGNLHDMFFSQEEAQEMAELKGTHAEVRPLYATPQRTWVGLTKKEVHHMYDSDYLAFHHAIEAKLKELNT